VNRVIDSNQNVPESLKTKRSVVQQLDELADEETIVASNSSSFTIQEIIEGSDLKQASRCVSLHSCMYGKCRIVSELWPEYSLIIWRRLAP